MENHFCKVPLKANFKVEVLLGWLNFYYLNAFIYTVLYKIFIDVIHNCSQLVTWQLYSGTIYGLANPVGV